MRKHLMLMALILIVTIFSPEILLSPHHTMNKVYADEIATPTPAPSTCTLTVTSNVLSAVADRVSINLNPPNQSCTYPVSAGYSNGTLVTLTAEYPWAPVWIGSKCYTIYFDHWTMGSVTYSNKTISITMDDNKSLYAYYRVTLVYPKSPTPTTRRTPTPTAHPTPTPVVNPDKYTLALSFPGLTGTSLEVNPPGVSITSGTSFTYDPGTLVTLKANNYNAPSGAVFMFVRWEGDLTGYQNPTSITMDGNKNVQAVYAIGDPPPSPTPTPITPTPTATSTPGWVSYIPTADQVVIKPDLAQGAVVVELTFPNAGYQVADPGSIAMSAGIYPDGSTLMTFLTAGTKIERYTGFTAQVITTKTITYKNLGFGTNNIFRFCVYDIPVEQIEFAGSVTGSPTPRPTPTVTPINPLKLQFYNQSTAATSNQIYTNIKLVNTGTGAIALSNVKIRYYYTIDGIKSQNFYCDYSPLGSDNVTGTFVAMAAAKTGADTYLEIGFTSGAGSLAAGASVTIQGRFAKSDWSNYTQTNDYSFNTSATTYVDWVKVTGYVSGALQWGTEP